MVVKLLFCITSDQYDIFPNSNPNPNKKNLHHDVKPDLK